MLSDTAGDDRSTDETFNVHLDGGDNVGEFVVVDGGGLWDVRRRFRVLQRQNRHAERVEHVEPAVGNPGTGAARCPHVLVATDLAQVGRRYILVVGAGVVVDGRAVGLGGGVGFLHGEAQPTRVHQRPGDVFDGGGETHRLAGGVTAHQFGPPVEMSFAVSRDVA